MLTGPQVAQRLGVHRVTLQRWIRAGLFPAPVRIGPRTVRFREADIEAIEKSGLPSSCTGGMESGWAVEQPDVPADELVTELTDDCCNRAERIEIAELSDD